MSSQNSTILAIDFGTKKMGIAVGQTITRTAQPLCTLSSPLLNNQWQSFQALINEWEPDKVLVGLPYNKAYDDTRTYEAALAFINEIKLRFNKPIVTIDEHLTSFAAKQLLLERGYNPKKVSLDAIAAMLILESWFNTYA